MWKWLRRKLFPRRAAKPPAPPVLSMRPPESFDPCADGPAIIQFPASAVYGRLRAWLEPDGAERAAEPNSDRVGAARRELLDAIRSGEITVLPDWFSVLITPAMRGHGEGI